MSWETQAWAAKQRAGSASAKLVLLGLASCADANHCAFPSIQWLCDFSDLNRKTVISALQRLEDGMFPMIEDTGERRGRTGQVKVYRLAAAGAGHGSDPASETVPKAEQFQKRNSSGLGSKQSQKRDTEPFREPNPLSTPDGVDAPPSGFERDLLGGSAGGDQGEPEPTPEPAGKAKPHVLPEDWEPPAIADLPPETRALVQQWPSGAYQHFAANFRDHWSLVDRKKRSANGHAGAFRNWLRRVHPEAMRAGKAGVSYATAAPSKPSAPMKPPPPVRAKAREDGWSERVHGRLKRDVGDLSYAHWLKPVAIIFDDPGVTVITNSEFARGWLDEHFGPKISAAASAVTGKPVPWVRFQNETSSINRPREREDHHGQGNR